MSGPERRSWPGLDRSDPAYRAAVRAAAAEAGPVDPATTARLRAVLAAPRTDDHIPTIGMEAAA